MRYEEFVKQLAEEIVERGNGSADIFPEMDLYADQTALYLSKKLAHYKRGKKDEVLTKDMIANYVKHDIIPKPVNKKYNRDHMIMLMLVHYLKGSFQMKEIRQLMKPLLDNYKSEFDDKIDLMQLCRSVVKIQRENRADLEDRVRKDLENIKKSMKEAQLADDDMLEILMLIATMSVRAESQRYLAQRLMEKYFIGAEDKAE